MWKRASKTWLETEEPRGAHDDTTSRNLMTRRDLIAT